MPTNQVEMLRANFEGASGRGTTLAVGQLSVARGEMATAITTDGSREIIVLSGGVQTTTGQTTVERIERTPSPDASGAPVFLVTPLEAGCQQAGLPEARWGRGQ